MTVRLPSPYRLHVHDTLDSTNAEAKRMAADGAPDGTVVWAREQTAGRGRRGREWQSGEGNLACSILLRPGGHAKRAMQLSFVAALGMADAVATVLPRSAYVTCKWPNDVLVEGRKISGILLESEAPALGGIEWLVVGAGLNIISHPDDTEYPATSLIAEGGVKVTQEQMLETFCLRFLAGMVTWKNLGFEPIRRAWVKRAHGLGKEITVRLERETLVGEFTRLDEDGALILLHNGAERRITAGDVYF
ncbi:MAG: biotin--[acetyl-CoA-carboxylase] ligase [Rhodospirillaceae bacterium]|jgi:BirA family transcriptional regulator, biotin operon repressor / biotin---[acetyl-CoA-carboxylase] ligase|nr:biotin--[acetyl-CoA-carboxylase] ligase [Rhodospirillaceae bacterium]MBT4219945.1 biotin--[acetyl-CoA-carboxylase] ligase [Rhodospirillaceae bacterium]MBT4464149.1 biotin--[acetyl-CoA-carboxylase] ligase [Rhodospirillaceae bacterium]MBT5013319.1 biotin--[acetyl-CoA-carboxylase] ligase [Rhodospirillaceae bacterium]MBT5309414.1 biotin--[acetyl-CoA-carboxylase] ligase [Rhodospirillaceae bacterium]